MEIEVKVKVEDLDEIARKARAAGLEELRARHFERNLLYDFQDRSLSISGCLLRVRHTDAEGLFTFKGRIVEDKRFKVRPEVETVCQDAEKLDAILKNIGLRTFFRYEKYRTEFRGQDCILTLDELPFGNFLEMEGGRQAIEALAAALEIDPARFMKRTYADLYGEYCREKGIPFGDILFPAAP